MGMTTIQAREGEIVLPPRVTASALAQIAGAVPETVLRAHRRGDLRGGARVGKAMTFPAKDAARWLKRRGITNVSLGGGSR